MAKKQKESVEDVQEESVDGVPEGLKSKSPYVERPDVKALIKELQLDRTMKEEAMDPTCFTAEEMKEAADRAREIHEQRAEEAKKAAMARKEKEEELLRSGKSLEESLDSGVSLDGPFGPKYQLSIRTGNCSPEMRRYYNLSSPYSLRLTIVRERRKRHFVKALALLGTTALATQVTGIETSTVYEWMKVDPEFKKAFEAAWEQSCDMLEIEAIRRATGYDEPLVYRGQVQMVDEEIDGVKTGRKIPATIRKASDILLIFLMKAKRPHLYRDNYKVEISKETKVTANVRIEVQEALTKMMEHAKSDKLLEENSIDAEFEEMEGVPPPE